MRFLAGGLKRGLLAFKICRHPIESMRQNGYFFRIVIKFDAHGKIACRHPVSRAHQTCNRIGDLGRHAHSHPHRTDQHQEGRVQIAQQEDPLDR